MKVVFWGTRGSLPVALDAGRQEAKAAAILAKAVEAGLCRKEDIPRFMAEDLPFHLRAGYGGNTSCVQMAESTEYVLCDAGSGLRDFGNSLLFSGRLKDPAVFHIFMSHLHWDHIMGFPFFVPAFMPQHRVVIHGCHPELEAGFINQQQPPHFPVPFVAMQADISFVVHQPGEVVEVGGLTVTALEQNHPQRSFGYSFKQNDLNVVYSTDSEHKSEAGANHEPYLEFIKNADLLIFDAQYTFNDAVGMKENWGHSSNVIGVELATIAGVKHLCLFHHEPTSPDESLDRFLNESRRFAKAFAAMSKSENIVRVSMAYDGLEIEL